jgi:hypothetical protein
MKPMIYKIVKWVLITFVSLHILNISLVVFLLQGEAMVKEGTPERMLINAALGIPYYDDDNVKNNAPDIVKYSKEEWLNFKCQPRELDYGMFVGNQSSLPTGISSDKRAHLNCLGVHKVSSRNNKSSKTVNGELCNNYFNCQLVNLAVHDYVLDHPKILWNILKIAERPCDYAQTPWMKNYLKCNRKFYWQDERDTFLDIIMYPWYLKKRIFIVISIWNSDNKQIAEFIVRRKDLE